MASRRTITEKNMAVLRALVDVQERTGGFPPTVREIGAELGMHSPSTVQQHIKKLVSAGLVERRGRRRVVTTLGHSAIRREELAA